MQNHKLESAPLAIAADDASYLTVPAAALWALGACIVVVLILFNTARSIVETWWVSETFTHGFFIVPLFLWMVWQHRTALSRLSARPDWLPIAMMPAPGLLWLLSRLADIQVGQQLALVLILILTLWAVLGRSISRLIGFPLAFLIFLAPVGDELVPALMDLTADFTVTAIRLTGIPIYREGLYFSLPSGNWSVVEACSGVRYLIASIMLGTLYSYLCIQRTSRRWAFIIVSALVPIVANSARAFIIVMLGHFSDMSIATGADHLVYGWLFFGVVMFLLFSLGRFFQEPASKSSGKAGSESSEIAEPQRLPASANPQAEDQGPATSQFSFLLCSVVIVLGTAVWPVWVAVMEKQSVNSGVISTSGILPDAERRTIEISNPGDGIAGNNGFDNSIQDTDWQPIMAGYDYLLIRQSFSNNQFPRVTARAFVYQQQTQGKEMISALNKLVNSENEKWQRTQSSQLAIAASISEAGVINVEQSILKSSPTSLLIWRWYRIGDYFTSNAVKAKFRETINKLTLKPQLSTTYILSTDADHPQARSALQKITTEVLQTRQQ